MPEIEIRPVSAADFPIILNYDRSYETDYVWQMDRTQEDGQVMVNFRTIRLPRPVKVEFPYTSSQLAHEWGERPTILVAWLDGAQVGYIRVKEQLVPGTAWISDMAVVKSARRQGIASGLVLAAQDWASNRNLRRMMIEMQSKNYPGIHMAYRLGFEFCGYQDHYYTNRDIALFFTRFLR